MATIIGEDSIVITEKSVDDLWYDFSRDSRLDY
jgi:hypothetical protein